jgi:chitin disaccharide deacetylase
MRYLIVNADDLGLTPGINRGISEAHRQGIVTSTSLMVDEPASEEAAHMCAKLPELSVGLHVKVTDEQAHPLVDLRAGGALCAELERQLELFRSLVGREPTHLDSHHNVHLLPDAAPCFAEVAEARDLTLRGAGPIRYLPSFYGQWDGQTHLEQIGVDVLLAMIEREVGDGFTELGCHPGYVDRTLASTYSVERETELRTLCDPIVRARLDELGVKLVSSSAARGLLVSADARRSNR